MKNFRIYLKFIVSTNKIFYRIKNNIKISIKWITKGINYFDVTMEKLKCYSIQQNPAIDSKMSI